MEATELFRFLAGVLLAATAFYLKRTVSLLDKLEDKVDSHSERLIKLEARLEPNTSRG